MDAIRHVLVITLTRCAIILILGVSSVGIASGQEHSPRTIRQIHQLHDLQGDPARLVTQVEDRSDTSSDLQDATTDKDHAITGFNPNDPANSQLLTTLIDRAKLLEIKAQSETLCANGLRLAQQVLVAPTLLGPEEELTEWERKMNFLVYTWFTEERRAEWYSAGKAINDYIDRHAERLSQMPNNQEKVELANRLFALLMNTQINVMEKMSHDLEAQINRIKEVRSSD